jgi:diguanylate cyclase (GGDEF)-like protein
MTPQNNTRYFFIILGLLIGFALYLQYSIEKNTQNLHRLELNKAAQYAKRITKYLETETNGDLKEYLSTHQEELQSFNNMLHAFLTDEFRYIFLLTKDQKGHYRFLLDGSLSDPVEFNTLFFPKSEQYDRVYQSGKAEIIEQHNGVEEVWKSLLYPVVDKNETRALLVMDLSRKYAASLSQLNSPLAKTVGLMQLFLWISFFFIAYMTYSYYRFRKSIMIDPMTGAATKLYLHEFLKSKELERYNIVLIDIDEFKRINQKFGYKNGDSLLRAFVETLLEIVPPETKVIRLGGTEFVLLMPKGNDLTKVVASIYDTIKEKRFIVENEPVTLTTSMTAMHIPEGAHSIEKILHILDEKMLEVKSRGKNDYAIVGEKHLDDLKYSDMDYIKKALDEERVTCLFQPICQTQSKKIVKYEALVRLIDDEDDSKLISPFYFLPVIKGTSQYIKMSKLVLCEVMRVLDRYEEIEVSMNLDLTDLLNREMMHLIMEKLHAHQENAPRLTFEIVEDMEVKEFEKVALIFDQLRTYGSKIALDDFGSGFANYTYLIKLDWDIIKIDGTLIKELLSNREKAEPIVQSINELAIYFNCDVVAEFVADAEIYGIVKHLFIEYSQGYYLAEPKPIETFMHESETPQ